MARSTRERERNGGRPHCSQPSVTALAARFARGRDSLYHTGLLYSRHSFTSVPMNLRHVASCGLVCAALALAGCDEGRQAPGEVAVRVVERSAGLRRARAFGASKTHATRRDVGVQGRAGVRVRRRHLRLLRLRAHARHDQHAGAPGRSRRSSRPRHSYTFVLTEVGGEVQPVVIEHPDAARDRRADRRRCTPASGLPAMDLYLERPGVGIAGATPRGTLQRAGADRPAHAAERRLRAVVDGGRQPRERAARDDARSTCRPASRRRSSSCPRPAKARRADQRAARCRRTDTVLYDRNATAELRVINGATDRCRATSRSTASSRRRCSRRCRSPSPRRTRTVPIGDAQRSTSRPSAIPACSSSIRRSPALRRNARRCCSRARRHARCTSIAVDDGRRIHNEAKMRFMNAASQFARPSTSSSRIPDGDPTPPSRGRRVAAPGATLSYIAARVPATTTSICGNAGTATCCRARRASRVARRRHLRRARRQRPRHGDGRRRAVRRLPLSERRARRRSEAARPAILRRPLPACTCPGSSVDRAFAS